ncbi:unnamed protein product [Prorocentrum cordatum]|uniref:Uncharacterized protein n=1 Tax=Prorocentrum cordatum TaxID=2364126 RepID=A0ABN9W072_9DINO|nr:unnamed protein product [Polarella glacialis]
MVMSVEKKPTTGRSTICLFAGGGRGRDRGPWVDMVCIQTQRRIRDFEPQHVTNTLWACARMQLQDPLMLRVLINRAIDDIGRYCPLDVSITTWACATLKMREVEWLRAVVRARLDFADFSPQNMSNFVWGLATLGFRNDNMVLAVGREASRKIQDFSPQELSNFCWALATMDLCDNLMLRAVAEEVDRRGEEATARRGAPAGAAGDGRGMRWRPGTQPGPEVGQDGRSEAIQSPLAVGRCSAMMLGRLGNLTDARVAVRTLAEWAQTDGVLCQGRWRSEPQRHGLGPTGRPPSCRGGRGRGARGAMAAPGGGPAVGGGGPAQEAAPPPMAKGVTHSVLQQAFVDMLRPTAHLLQEATPASAEQEFTRAGLALNRPRPEDVYFASKRRACASSEFDSKLETRLSPLEDSSTPAGPRLTALESTALRSRRACASSECDCREALTCQDEGIDPVELIQFCLRPGLEGHSDSLAFADLEEAVRCELDTYIDAASGCELFAAHHLKMREGFERYCCHCPRGHRNVPGKIAERGGAASAAGPNAAPLPADKGHRDPLSKSRLCTLKGDAAYISFYNEHELSAARAAPAAQLQQVQPWLLDVGSALCTPRAAASSARKLRRRGDAGAADAQLSRLQNFTLPGGSPGSGGAARGASHVPSRRAVICVFLNLLSDFLFVAARLDALNADRSEQECAIEWRVGPWQR